MKTSNYLIALAALTSLTLVGCSDNDFLGDGPGGTFGGSSSKGELSFAAGGDNTTRAGDITGEKAADKLGGHFTVYGWKQVNEQSNTGGSSNISAFQDVFADYVVKWNGTASAGTTESNSSGWEYVGYQTEPVDGSAPSDQYIHYWDWSTNRYDFQAWSISEGNAQILTRNQVTNLTTPTATPPELTFFAPTAKDLGGVYVSDKFTSVPDFDADKGRSGTAEWADKTYDGVDYKYAGLADINNHPDNQHHRGVYNQSGKLGIPNNTDGRVNFMFRNLAAKVRIGIYETIPGYKVSNIVFYEVPKGTGTGYAANKYLYTWSSESYSADLNADYPADQNYATLFAADEIFARQANVTVKYHDSYYNNDATVTPQKDNVAYTAIDPKAEKFFAFGKLTNERGTDTWIANDPIGVTSNTASMSIGNDKEKLYTYVFPMEDNDESLELRVNYLLTSLDGSGEQIRVTGANATVPAEFAQWRSNYAYTYLFKISDNTNGNTGETYGPEGLYPITFDACIVNVEDGLQETITTINDRSITTYQNGSEVTKNDEYICAADHTTDPAPNDTIYFTVENGSGGLVNLTASANVWLYTAYAPEGTLITEESVANYKNNDIVLTDVSNKLIFPSEAKNTSGAKYPIAFTSPQLGAFVPYAKTYVIKYKESDSHISYKVIKVQNGSAAKTYAISLAASEIANNGNTTFTIDNSNTDANSVGKVTGAKGAIAIYDGSTKVNDKFKIEETSDYNYKITALEAEGTKNYTIKLDGASDVTLKVDAPAWSAPSINIEENTTGSVTLTDKTGGAALTGITPTVTPTTSPAASASKGTLAIEETSAGTYAITPSKGAYGTFTVSYHGANLTVNVDKYKLALDHSAIINKGDEQHNQATLTLTNESNSTGKTAVDGIAVSATPADIVTLSATGFPAAGAITVTAAKAGTSTISAKNATINIEVVDITLATAATPADGVKRVSLTDNTKTGDAAKIDGASFTIVKGDSGSANISVAGTTEAGVYKVSGGTAGKSYTIQYKYKGQVVADVDVTM